jgi:hypothetical protein
MEVAAMNGLDTLMTISQQVMLLPDQYLRQGITILHGAIHLARREEEARREQALLVREALADSGAIVAQPTAMTAVGQTQPEPNQKWAQDFRAGDPDRQHVAASEAGTLISALEAMMDRLQYTNVTERQLVLEVREAIARVQAMGNHEPGGEESAAAS